MAPKMEIRSLPFQRWRSTAAAPSRVGIHPAGVEKVTPFMQRRSAWR